MRDRMDALSEARPYLVLVDELEGEVHAEEAGEGDEEGHDVEEDHEVVVVLLVCWHVLVFHNMRKCGCTCLMLALLLSSALFHSRVLRSSPPSAHFSLPSNTHRVEHGVVDVLLGGAALPLHHRRRQARRLAVAQRDHLAPRQASL